MKKLIKSIFALSILFASFPSLATNWGVLLRGVPPDMRDNLGDGGFHRNFMNSIGHRLPDNSKKRTREDGTQVEVEMPDLKKQKLNSLSIKQIFEHLLELASGEDKEKAEEAILEFLKNINDKSKKSEVISWLLNSIKSQNKNSESASFVLSMLPKLVAFELCSYYVRILVGYAKLNNNDIALNLAVVLMGSLHEYSVYAEIADSLEDDESNFTERVLLIALELQSLEKGKLTGAENILKYILLSKYKTNIKSGTNLIYSGLFYRILSHATNGNQLAKAVLGKFLAEQGVLTIDESFILDLIKATNQNKNAAASSILGTILGKNSMVRNQLIGSIFKLDREFAVQVFVRCLMVVDTDNERNEIILLILFQKDTYTLQLIVARYLCHSECVRTINFLIVFLMKGNKQFCNILGLFLAEVDNQKLKEAVLNKIFQIVKTHEMQALCVLKVAVMSTKDEILKKAILEKYPNILGEEKPDEIKN